MLFRYKDCEMTNEKGIKSGVILFLILSDFIIQFMNIKNKFLVPTNNCT